MGWRTLGFLGLVGCAGGPTNITYRQIGFDDEVGIDGGITPSDVLNRLAARDYDAAPGADAPNLPTYAPFRINPGTQYATAFSRTVTSAVDGSFVSISLVLHVPVRVRSADGTFDFTSTAEIEATSRTDLQWRTSSYSGDASDVAWVTDERATAWADAGCDADDVDLAEGQYVLLPTGSAADGGPSELELAAVWPDKACTSFASLEKVGIVAAE